MEEQIKQINEVLHEHYFNDLKKSEINKTTRKNIILNYIKENKSNLYQMSDKFGVPYATLKEWSDGKDIYQPQRIKLYVPLNKTRLNILLRETINTLQNKHKVVSEETIQQIKLLENAINTFKFRHKI